MFSILRIEGDEAEVSASYDRIRATTLGSATQKSRRGGLTVDLSREIDWDRHQSEVEDSIAVLSPVLDGVESRGANAYLDFAVYLQPPSGDSTLNVRSYRLRPSLLERLAGGHIPFEITIYVSKE